MLRCAQEQVSPVIDPIVTAAIESGVTPGAVLVAGDRMRDVLSRAFGSTHYEPDPDRTAVTAETIYDIASLTKPIATAAVLMRLCSAGSIHLSDAVAGIEGRGDITVRHLVGHAAGFPDHVRFYERLWDGDLAGKPTAREALFEMARTVDRIYEPGVKTIYSDIGFILLGEHLERVTGRRLDALVREHVTEPLGLSATRFVDLDDPDNRISGSVAPTERCPRRGLVCGEVHDENAHAAGGICGHAGLFSTGADVARFAREICAAVRGEAAIFDRDTVTQFLSTSAAPGTTRRLGWDTPSSAGVTHAGALWPRTGVGHLGFTGCSMWLDPPAGRYVVLLTNRVHPKRPETNAGIKNLRRAVMDAVVRELDGS